MTTLPNCSDLLEPEGGIIFSLVDGFVWASWPGIAPKVRLGRSEGVAAMMRDFLAQGELAARLERGEPSHTSNQP